MMTFNDSPYAHHADCRRQRRIGLMISLPTETANEALSGTQHRFRPLIFATLRYTSEALFYNVNTSSTSLLRLANRPQPTS